MRAGHSRFGASFPGARCFQKTYFVGRTNCLRNDFTDPPRHFLSAVHSRPLFRREISIPEEAFILVPVLLLFRRALPGTSARGFHENTQRVQACREESGTPHRGGKAQGPRSSFQGSISHRFRFRPGKDFHMKTEKRSHPETLKTAKWDAIGRALRCQGYVIVLDGDVSRIVRKGKPHPGKESGGAGFPLYFRASIQAREEGLGDSPRTPW